MTDSERPPKFDYMARPKVYGVLDASHELLICFVTNGRLSECSRPISWESGILEVGTAESYNKIAEAHRIKQEERTVVESAVAAWKVAHQAWRDRYGIPAKPYYVKDTTSLTGQREWKAYNEVVAAAAEPEPKTPDKYWITVSPPESLPYKKLMMGLNDDRSAYEIVYDPHGLEADIDPMMLLNFRRKTRA